MTGKNPRHWRHGHRNYTRPRSCIRHVNRHMAKRYELVAKRNQRPSKASRMTQRKPRCEVDVSMGCAIRAAGR